jgi:Arc/MetJ-type ribon-helix-helix transcriptional regulator
MQIDANGNPANNEPKPAATPEEIQALVQAQVDEQLKEIKSKLDAAYGSRDDAVRKAAQLEEAEKAARLKALEAEGKHKEVAEMKIASLEEKLKIAEQRNIEYTRDAAVRSALGGLEFRNERSQQMAYRDVVEQLVQDKDTGQWVHRTGVAIKDFVSAFAKDDENSFLFKPKVNSGSGGVATGGIPNLNNKKLLEMTTAEVMALATAGKLGELKI